jgi:putative tricarboxylic transport membrane protein
MEWLGTIVTVVLITALLPLLWGERRWKYLIPFVIIFPAVVIVLFKVLFSVNFEPGVIGLGIK